MHLHGHHHPLWSHESEGDISIMAFRPPVLPSVPVPLQRTSSGCARTTPRGCAGAARATRGGARTSSAAICCSEGALGERKKNFGRSYSTRLLRRQRRTVRRCERNGRRASTPAGRSFRGAAGPYREVGVPRGAELDFLAPDASSRSTLLRPRAGRRRDGGILSARRR